VRTERLRELDAKGTKRRARMKRRAGRNVEESMIPPVMV
jgi:hypothetical protein